LLPLPGLASSAQAPSHPSTGSRPQATFRFGSGCITAAARPGLCPVGSLAALPPFR
jgi:hypothetical protein